MRIFFSNKEINLKNSLNQYEKITCQILIVVVFQCIKHNLGNFFETKNVPPLNDPLTSKLKKVQIYIIPNIYKIYIKIYIIRTMS